MKRIGLIMLALGLVGAACGTSGGGGTGQSESSMSTITDGGGGGADAADADADAQPAKLVAAEVRRTDIVSDRPGALRQDAKLINAWGLSFNPAGVAWVSANGSGTSEVYDATGAPRIPAVTIPAPPGSTDPSAPTGQAFNANPNAFGGDAFLFVTEDGTIAGWKLADTTNAVLRVDNSAKGANYKGVTIATGTDGKSRLYAADFAGGKIDVYDDAFAPVATTGAFADPGIPSGYAPFNVQEALGGLIVTYALQDDAKKDDVKGPGHGFVDVFDLDGHLIVRLVSRGALNSPWGIATSSSGYGKIPFRLFVGNFGDGRINVYGLHEVDGLARLVHEGPLGDASGQPLTIDGLWALRFGPGAGGFGADQLFFTAGPGDESHGVFGRLDLVRQP